MNILDEFGAPHPMLGEYDTAFGHDAERTERCPNCGTEYPRGECTHWSTQSIHVPGVGTYTPTLYGVCERCADQHKRLFDALNKVNELHEDQ